jgi:HEAT repeat protein
MLDKAAAGLKSSDIRFKAAAALALGAVGEKATKYGDDIAALLTDSSEDKSSLIYKVAGIERKSSPSMRIPACAAASALALIDGNKYSGKIAGLLNSNSLEVKTSAIVALGDAGTADTSALTPLLDDSAAVIRASAACTLGKIASATAPQDNVAERVAQRLVDESPVVKASCAQALGMMGDGGADFSDAVHDLFKDQSKVVRSAAVKAMGGIGLKGQIYAAHVARMMTDPEALVRAAAVSTMPEFGERGAAFADECAELLYDEDASVRAAASSAMSKMGDVGQNYLTAAGVPMAIEGTDAIRKRDSLASLQVY